MVSVRVEECDVDRVVELQANDYFGAFVYSLARKCHRPAVRFGQAFYESEADSQTRVR